MASIYIQVSSLSNFFFVRILLPYQNLYIENHSPTYIQPRKIHKEFMVLNGFLSFTCNVWVGINEVVLKIALALVISLLWIQQSFCG